MTCLARGTCTLAALLGEGEGGRGEEGAVPYSRLNLRVSSPQPTVALVKSLYYVSMNPLGKNKQREEHANAMYTGKSKILPVQSRRLMRFSLSFKIESGTTHDR